MNSLFALLGAYIYRMRGGMEPSFPRPIDQVLFSIPYGLIFGLQFTEWFSIYEGIAIGLMALGLTTWAVLKGHGNNMDLGEGDASPEWYESVMRWLKPKVPLYWYDCAGMAVSGLTYTLPAGILTLNPILALSGILKAPAYMLGKKADAGTMGGELLTGALLWGVVWGAM